MYDGQRQSRPRATLSPKKNLNFSTDSIEVGHAEGIMPHSTIMKSLNISDVISESWQLLSKHYLVIAGTLIVYLVLYSLGPILIEILPEDASVLKSLINIVDLVFSYFLITGLYRFGLNLVQERDASIGDLFSQSGSTLLRFILVSLLVGLIVFVGFILLIIPGIILSLKYSMVWQVVVDQRLGPLEAMAKSSVITSGNRFQLFLLGIVNLGIILLGVILLGVGLIVAVPLCWLTTFVSYEMLKSSSSQLSA
ncbi:MAG: DUF975 family protein [Leptolyngbyaceae cyanobacterium]